MPLSPREQQVLAAIEKDLSAQDPRLARTMTRTARWASGPQRFPLRRQHMATLGAALLTLILVHALVGDIHPAASAALTGGLIITWLMYAARAAARSAAVIDPTTAARPP
jgi:Flp pilus assembly protein TadB